MIKETWKEKKERDKEVTLAHLIKALKKG